MACAAVRLRFSPQPINQMENKMRALKITASNAGAIEALLVAVNGKATAHTFTRYAEVAEVAEVAEARVMALLGAKSAMRGAQMVATSSGPVAALYKHWRKATKIIIERRASGWWLIEAREWSLGYRDGGVRAVRLTAMQDAVAILKLQSQYALLPAG